MIMVAKISSVTGLSVRDEGSAASASVFLQGRPGSWPCRLFQRSEGGKRSHEHTVAMSDVHPINDGKRQELFG